MDIRYYTVGKKTVVIFAFLLSFFCGAMNASQVGNITSKGDMMMQKGDYAKAIACYSKLIQDYKRHPDSYQEYALALKKGGNICCEAQRYIEALEFFTLGMDAASKIDDQHLYLSCMGNIGTIYGIFNDYERALYYYKKVYFTALKCGENEVAGTILINIVKCYCYTGNIDEAKRYFLLQAQASLKNESMKRYFVLYNQGLIATAEKNFSGALYFYKMALNYTLTNGMPTEQSDAILLEIGKSYCTVNKTDSAKNYLERCVRISDRDGFSAYMSEACHLLAKIYMKDGNEILYHKYDSIYRVISSSIYNQKKFSEATNQLYKYEDKVSTEKIDSLNKKVNAQLLVIIAFIILIAGLVLAIVVIYRQKKRQDRSYRLLIDKEKELVVSHDQSKQLRDKYLEALTKKQGHVTDISSDSNVTDEELTVQNDAEDRNEELIKKISTVMDNPQFIFSPDFSLSVLCREVASNTKYVSKAINDTYKKNFKTLVNEYRIREAMLRLGNKKAGDDVSISGIATALGYNSSTSFIIAFKKIIGMTPAMYRRLLKDGDTNSERDDERDADKDGDDEM